MLLGPRGLTEILAGGPAASNLYELLIAACQSRPCPATARRVVVAALVVDFQTKHRGLRLGNPTLDQVLATGCPREGAHGDGTWPCVLSLAYTQAATLSGWQCDGA